MSVSGRRPWQQKVGGFGFAAAQWELRQGPQGRERRRVLAAITVAEFPEFAAGNFLLWPGCDTSR